MKSLRSLFPLFLSMATLAAVAETSFSSPHCSSSNPMLSAVIDKTDAEAWREDLRYMAQEMEKRHKNLFHDVTREQFYAAVKNLHDRMPSLARHQIIVELMRIVAMVKDLHTTVLRKWAPPISFRIYPLRLYFYKDGLFVQKATREHAKAAGARVIKIGKASVDQAYNAVRELVSHENEMGLKDLAPDYLTTPEILHALGLIEDMENAPFLLERAGEQFVVKLKPVNPALATVMAANMVDASDGAKEPLPLWRKDPRNRFWFEYLKDSQTLYVQYNSVADKPDETVAQFSERVFQFVNANPIERFVLDLRLNHGGTDILSRPLLLGIIKSDKIDRKGKLFVIIGRHTVSAAQDLVNELEKYTNALFVGEPTGQNVHFYSDLRQFELPNSKIRVGVAVYWFQNLLPNDKRKWTAPHIIADLTSDDYRTNTDPAMKAIFSYDPQQGSHNSNPCESPEAKAFDFQIGVWQEVNGTGLHEVKKILNNCAIQENWTGGGLNDAVALKSYDIATERWYLSWVSSALIHQLWQGRKESGQWRFYREWMLDGNPIVSRTYWTLLSDGHLERIVEQSRDGGKTWRLHVRALYQRKK